MVEEKEVKEEGPLSLECNDSVHPRKKYPLSSIPWVQNIPYKKQTKFMQCVYYLYFDIWLQLELSEKRNSLLLTYITVVCFLALL